MRWFVLTGILLVAIALTVAFFVHAPHGRTQLPVSQAGAVVTIPVEGMSCVSCAATVKKTLQTIGGVAEVEVSLEHRTARIRYVDGKVSPDQLVAAINRLGYRARAPRVGEIR